MDPVEKQFPPIGKQQEIEQSQTVTEVEPDKEESSESDSDPDSDDSGDYVIMLPDEDRPGRFKPKFFDKEGFTIITMTANRLEKKDKKKKKKSRESKQKKRCGHQRAQPVGISSSTIPQGQRQEHGQETGAAECEDVIVKIPMKLDLSKLPPPPTPIREVNANFKKWLDNLAMKFGHLQTDAPSEARSAVRQQQVQVPVSAADPNGRTTSAPQLIASVSTQTAVTHRYSEQCHVRTATPKDTPPPKDKPVPKETRIPRLTPPGKKKTDSN